MKNEKAGNNRTSGGKSFHDHQRAVDSAVNERIKNESHGDKNAQLNRTEKRDRHSDISQKKTGGGKQKSTGD